CRQRLGQLGDATEIPHRGAARRPYVLDRRIEQALEALLHELADLAFEQAPRNREVALGRQTVEPDRRAAEAIWVAGAGRLVAEAEGDVEGVDLVRGGEHASGLGLRERRVGGVREVLLVDRGRDRLRVAGQARVLGADVAFE